MSVSSQLTSCNLWLFCHFTTRCGSLFWLVFVCDHSRGSVFSVVGIVLCFCQNYLAYSQFPIFIIQICTERENWISIFYRQRYTGQKRIWKIKVTPLPYTKTTSGEFNIYILIKEQKEMKVIIEREDISKNSRKIEIIKENI